jgi:hypothetical protein
LHLKQNASDTNDNYNPQIYVKNTEWNPPPASLEVENNLTSFEKAIANEIRLNQQLTLQHKRHQNLNKLQLKTLQQLKNNYNFIIKPTDKNLGPAIMNLDDYINMVLNEHLLTSTYIQLSKETAINKLSTTQSHLKKLINTNK